MKADSESVYRARDAIMDFTTSAQYKLCYAMLCTTNVRWRLLLLESESPLEGVPDKIARKLCRT